LGDEDLYLKTCTVTEDELLYPLNHIINVLPMSVIYKACLILNLTYCPQDNEGNKMQFLA